MPNMIHASTYSSVLQYLKAVKAAGTDATEAVTKKLHEMPVDDFFGRKGKVLEIMFAPGVRFWVEPHADEDGWGPYGIQGQVIVCLPGSEMCIWYGRPKRAAMPVMLDSAAEPVVTRSSIID